MFFCQNNQWAISEPLEKQTRIPLYRRAHGFGFHGVRVDGNDVLAVLAVTRRHLQAAREGGGPSLIEAFTYRMGAHTTSDDPTRYRLASDLEAWKLRDPIERMRSFLWKNQLVDQDVLRLPRRKSPRRWRYGCATAAGRCPTPTRSSIFDHVYAEPHALVDEERAAFADYLGAPSTGVAPGRRSRAHEPETLTMAKALNLGLRRCLEADDKTLIMGEDIGKLGGVFRVTDALQKDFGEHRVIDTPLAESAILGTAIGLAMRGYRPIVEIQFDGFVYLAFDQIVSQLAKMHARSAGQVPMPVVVRIPSAVASAPSSTTARARRRTSPTRPGLRVVSPSHPVDAYWMLRQAVACDDPVIFFEPKRRYWDKAEVDEIGRAPVPLSSAGSLGRAPTSRWPATGRWCAPVWRPPRLPRRRASASRCIDLRSLSPVDLDLVCASVERTGRLVVVHEAPVWLGLGAEIAARVQERCFYSLEAPVLRVGGFHSPYPPSRVEEHYLPDLDRVLDAVDRALEH